MNDDDTFGQVYSRHGPAVYAFLRGLHGRDEHAALDSLQETFLKAYAAWSGFDSERPVLPWLFTIASRVRIDASRRERIAIHDPDSLTPSTDDDVPERVALGDACGRLLHVAAGRLPNRKLEAFILARTRGLTYAEIASLRGCSTATVKRDIRDAAAVLASAAEELGLAPPPVEIMSVEQLDAALRWHEAFRDHVNQIRTLASGEIPAADLLESLAAFDDQWTEIEASLPGGEEELSWALGATLQASRALLPDSGELWADLVREAEGRIERLETELTRDLSAELRIAEREHAMAASMIEVAEAAFIAAAEEDEADEDDAEETPEELEDAARMQKDMRAMIAQAAERVERLRAGSPEELARRRARVQRALDDANAHRSGLRDLAARVRSTRAATPKEHLDRVAAQLPRVTRALTYLLVP